MSKRCSSCGYINSDDSKGCISCGYRFVSSWEQEKRNMKLNHRPSKKKDSNAFLLGMLLPGIAIIAIILWLFEREEDMVFFAFIEIIASVPLGLFIYLFNSIFIYVID